MERLKRLGLHVVYFDRPQNLNGLLENFLKLSHLLGRSEQGAAIVAEVKGARSRRQSGHPYNVLWQVEAEPLMVASTASFANDVIRLAGGRNVVDTELPYPRINVEEVIVKAPDVIVLMDMGYNIKAEMKRWRGYLRCPVCRHGFLYHRKQPDYLSPGGEAQEHVRNRKPALLAVLIGLCS
jgi:ABC-type Fe3+-hydroxamate transport system substrate-binding protein